MFASEFRKMKVEDLRKEIESAQEELVKTHDGIISGKETEVRKSLKLRRKIARMLTVLSEKESEENVSEKSK